MAKAPTSSARPSSNIPRQSLNPNLNRPAALSRTNSPQISRRGSTVWGPRPLTPSLAGYESPGGSRPVLRNTFSSQRLSSLAQPPSPARSQSGYEARPRDRFSQYDSPAQQDRYASTCDLPPLFPSYLSQSPGAASPSLRRRFADVPTPPIINNTLRGKKRALSKRQGEFEIDEESNESDGRTGKRLRGGDDSEGEYSEMDIEESEGRAAGGRGTKRGAESESEEEEQEERRPVGKSKRSRLSEPQDKPESDEELDQGAESDYSGRKRRAHDSGSDDHNSAIEEKRARSGRSDKPFSKRAIDDVDESSGDDDYQPQSTRNADSDVDESEEGVDEEEEQDRKLPRRGSVSKKSKSKNSRSDTEDQDIMDGAFSPPSPPGRSSELSSPRQVRKRAPSSTKKVSSKLGSKTRSNLAKAEKGLGSKEAKTKRQIGEEWTNLEGDRYKIGSDGAQRRACEVREVRKMYSMPKDSRHPDRDATREIVVEKWLTDAEYDLAVSEKLLTWQYQDPVEVPVAEDDSMQGVVKPESEVEPVIPAAPETGFYFTPGIGTPLRTHSSLSNGLSSGLSSGKASPLSASTTPVYKTYLNGRLRLPSASTSASPARTWSSDKASRILEDEQKASQDREKRRKASVRLGGEIVKDEEEEKEEEKGVEVKVVVQEKLKLPDFSLDKSVFGTTAATATDKSATIKELPSLFAKPVVAIPAIATSKVSALPVKIAPISFSSSKTITPSPLSFGSGSKEASPKAATPAFNFAKPAAAFDFAKPAATESSVDLKPAAPSTTATSFSFKAPVAPSVTPTKVSEAAPLFSIPAKTTAPSQTVPTSAPNAPFSFGAASEASVPKAAEASTGLNFGAPPTPDTPKVADAATSISFSAPAAKTALASAPPSAFSFGNPSTPFSSTSASITPKAVPAPAAFNFATPSAVPSPAPLSKTFSFGAPCTSNPPIVPSPFHSIAPPAAAAAPAPFPFGPPAVSTPAAPANTFGSFGTTTASTTSPFSVPTPAVTAPSFLFGGAAPVAVTAAPSFGGFGSTPAPAPTSAPAFAFGSTAPSAPAAASPFGGFGASTAPAAGGFSFGTPSAPAMGGGGMFGAPPAGTCAGGLFGGGVGAAFSNTGPPTSDSGERVIRKRPGRK